VGRKRKGLEVGNAAKSVLQGKRGTKLSGVVQTEWLLRDGDVCGCLSWATSRMKLLKGKATF